MKNIQLFLLELRNLIPVILALEKKGAASYLVGGSVRDLVLHLPVVDFDIEIHGISSNCVEKVLQQFGNVSLIGKKFGVFKIHTINADWSLPRKDNKGRKPKVVIDTNMTIQEACKRRDVTMNAMAIDLNFLSKNINNIEQKLVIQKEHKISEIFSIIDPYGGLIDIKKGIISVVDEKTFIEDPLRFFRVMQFVGRFEMRPNSKLEILCK